MSATPARRLIHRCLTLLLALPLGGQLVLHEALAHDAMMGGGAHATVENATPAPAPAAHEHEGHHGMAAATEQVPASEAPVTHCDCDGIVSCAASAVCAPARPTIVLEAITAPLPRAVVVEPAPRTDHGARLLPFANGPPVMRAVLA